MLNRRQLFATAVGAVASSKVEGPTLMTADQWNWYRKEATGIVQPEPEKFGFAGPTRFLKVTKAEYDRRRAYWEQFDRMYV